MEKQKDFNVVYKRQINNKLRYFSSDSIELPLHSVNDFVVQNLVVRFSADWFADITKEVSSKSSSLTSNKLKTYQIFDGCYSRIETQILKIKKHYQPKGVIFLVAESRNIYDTVVGAVALDLALPIIQLNQFGKKAVNEAFTAKDLAHRLVEVIKTYREPVNLESPDDLTRSSSIVNFDDL